MFDSSFNSTSPGESRFIDVELILDCESITDVFFSSELDDSLTGIQ